MYGQRAAQQQQPNVSYKTNVNRMKTKRWVEAKQYSYDGGDWGDEDEEDEEDIPSAEPTQPVPNQQPAPVAAAGPSGPAPGQGPPRPTGLRQQGQQSAFGVASPPASAGGVPLGQPPQFPQQGGRTGSFSAGDESNAFKAARQPAQIDTNVPPRQAPTGPRANPPPQSPGSATPRDPNVGAETSRIPSNSSTATDPQNRRDFSPSAMVPPLATKAGQSPASAINDGSNPANYPPRKQSLTTPSRPSPIEVHPYAGRTTATTTARSPTPQEDATPRAGTPGSATARSPFVRPSDIYKRIAEEREKERLASEAARKTEEKTQAPVQSTAPAPGTSLATAPAVASTSAAAVAGPSSAAQPAPSSPTSPKLNLPIPHMVEQNPQAQAKKHTRQASSQASTMSKPGHSKKPSSPTNSRFMLPELGSISGFGDEFDMSSWAGSSANAPSADSGILPAQSYVPQKAGSHSKNSSKSSIVQQMTARPSAPPQAPAPAPPVSADAASLQHQTSVGFRSAVNQAFDTSIDRSSSVTSSVANSQRSPEYPGVTRSNTNSTSDISPIMSRAPSAANENASSRNAAMKAAAPSAIAEEPEGPQVTKSRTASNTSTSFGPGVKAASAAHSRDVSNSSATKVIPGYRRDLNPPSRDNSPARTPEVKEATTPEAEKAKPQYSRPSTANSQSRLADSVLAAPTEPTEPFTKDPVANAETSVAEAVAAPTAVEGAEVAQGPKTLERPPAQGPAGSFRPQLPGGWISQSSFGSNNDITKIDGRGTPPQASERSETPPTNVPTHRKNESGGRHRPMPMFDVTAIEGAAALASPSIPTPATYRYDGRPDSTIGDPREARIPASSLANSTVAEPQQQEKARFPKIDPAASLLPNNGELPDLPPNSQSPQRDSDRLADEIERSLSPQNEADAQLESVDKHVQPTTEEHDTSATSDIYDSYANDPEEEHHEAPAQEAHQVEAPAAIEHTVSPLPAPVVPVIEQQHHEQVPETVEHRPESATPPPLVPPKDPSRNASPAISPLVVSPETEEPPHYLNGLATGGTEGSIASGAAAILGADHHAGNMATPSSVEPAAELEKDEVQEGASPALRRQFSWTSGAQFVDLSLHDPSTPKALQDPHQNQFHDHEYDDGPEPVSALDRSTTRDLSEKQLAPTATHESAVTSPLSTHNLDELAALHSQNTQATEDPASAASATVPAQHTRSLSAQQPPAPGAKLMAFREILAISNPADRINAYKRTQHQFASQDTGLSSWLGSMLVTNPELSGGFISNGPGGVAPGPAPITPHKRTPSGLGGLKHGGPMKFNYPAVSSGGTPSSQGGRSVSSGTADETMKKAQVKGKELLHTASVLSGKTASKATTSAKSLFAKGRSRFRGGSEG